MMLHNPNTGKFEHIKITGKSGDWLFYEYTSKERIIQGFQTTGKARKEMFADVDGWLNKDACESISWQFKTNYHIPDIVPNGWFYQFPNGETMFIPKKGSIRHNVYFQEINK